MIGKVGRQQTGIVFIFMIMFTLLTHKLTTVWRLNTTNITLTSLWQSEVIFHCQEYRQKDSLPSITPNTSGNTPLLQIQNGRLHWLAGECQEATMQWGQALALVPTNYTAKFLWAGGLYSQGETTKATDIYKEIVSATYLSQIPQFMQGDISINELVNWYALSFDLDPNPNVGYLLADAYISLHQQNKAIIILTQIQKNTDEHSEDNWWSKGLLAELNNQPQDAINAYKQGVEYATDRYPFYWRIATLCLDQQNYLCANSNYLSAWEDKPLRINPLLALGNIAHIQGNDEDSIYYYQLANQVYEPSELPELYQGIVLWDNKNLNAAEIILLNAHQQNKKNADILYYLSQVTYAQGSTVEATRYLENAVTLKSTPSYLWLLLLSQWYIKDNDCQSVQGIYPTLLASDLPNNKLISIENNIVEICSP